MATALPLSMPDSLKNLATALLAYAGEISSPQLNHLAHLVIAGDERAERLLEDALVALESSAATLGARSLVLP